MLKFFLQVFWTCDNLFPPRYIVFKMFLLLMHLWQLSCFLFFELTFLMFKYSWSFNNGACVLNVFIFGVLMMVIMLLMFLLLVLSTLTMVIVLLMFILMVHLWWLPWFWCSYWCFCNGHHAFWCSYSYYSCDGHRVLDVLAHGHHVLDVFTLGAFTMVFMFLMFLLLLIVFMMFLLLVCL